MDFNKFFCLIFLICLAKDASSICLFPPEIEGEYIVQNSIVSNGGGIPIIQYSTVNITADSLFPYGQCYSRNSSNVIVVLGSEDNECYRCFSLQMVSKNIILLIHNEENINSKCSSSAETVKCPEEIKLNDENQSDFHSIILYKTSERDSSFRRNEFCPFDFFDGEVKFDYFLNDEKVCAQNSLTQCPSGMNLRFNGCNHSPQSINFECIGHWKALNKNYLVVIEWMNSTATYKCGTYHFENNDKTEITLKINNDCSSLSGRNGKILTPKTQNQQIFKIQTKSRDNFKSNAEKNFPDWLQGHWQFLDVNGTELIYRDQTSFKFYRMTLVEQVNSEKFAVKTRSQCGEESFKCLFIRKLDTNILEFQMLGGAKNQLGVCNEEHVENGWLTQARVDNDVIKTSCPISGKYFGQIPDSPELCAKMTSNCNSPDIMHFEIGLCDLSEIYEKRVYRCLGQWTDKDLSTVYTFTKRDDVVNTYECFVGLMAKAGSDKQIVIREAGENCYKKLDPLKYGMEMNKTETCQNNEDEEIIVKPTQKESTITYETVFDDKNNNIDFDVATSTRKPKTTKKHNIVDNDQLNETTSTATKGVMDLCGFVLMIAALLNYRGYFMTL